MSRQTGARKVAVAVPGARPISSAPLMVQRFLTSSTDIPRTAAARPRALSIASFRLAPEPMKEMGAVSSSFSTPHWAARASAAGRCIGDDGAAVLYGTKHIDLRAENTVGVFVDDNSSLSFRHNDTPSVDDYKYILLIYNFSVTWGWLGVNGGGGK